MATHTTAVHLGSVMALSAAEVALLPLADLFTFLALPLPLLLGSSFVVPLSELLCTSRTVSSSAELAAFESLELTLSTQPALASLTTRLEIALDAEEAPTSSSMPLLLLLVALTAVVVVGVLVAGAVVVGVLVAGAVVMGVLVAGKAVVGVLVEDVGVVVADEELLEHVIASVSSV